MKKPQKKHAKLLSSLIALSFTGCANAISDEHIGDDIEYVAEFSTHWISKINYAINDFNTISDKLDCFAITLEENNNEYIVSISASDTVRIDSDSIAINPKGFDDCGTGATYHFDTKSGSFIKRVYQR